MNLDRWKWVGGFAAGIVVGIIFFSAWTYADSLEDVERRVSVLEAGRLAQEAELRVRERTAEPGGSSAQGRSSSRTRRHGWLRIWGSRGRWRRDAGARCQRRADRCVGRGRPGGVR